MEITIYTNEGCIWCTRTKELMARASQEYTEVNWQKISVEEQVAIKEKFGEKLQAFPVVIIDGEFVGGLVETAKIFIKKGLVSARQS